MTQAVAALLASTSPAVAGAPAPVLTAATDTARGPTSATIGVSTTIGDGTCSWVILLAADSTPLGTEIEAGQKSGGAAAEDAGSKTVTGTGVQTFSVKPTMLDPSIAYKVAFVHRSSAGVLSNVIVGDGFTTTAIVAGGLDGGGTSTTDPTDATGSVVVEVGDIVVGVFSEGSGVGTVTGVTDNLGNTYTAPQAALTSGGVVSGHSWQSKVTVPGTLTAIHFDSTASTNDCAAKGIVFKGPFNALDAAPVNKTDNARPWTGTATGTLAEVPELVVGTLAVATAGGIVTANAPFTLADTPHAPATRTAAILYAHVKVTTTVTPSFTGATADTSAVIGTMSFTRAA